MSILINEDYANPTTPLWAAAGTGGGADVKVFWSTPFSDNVSVADNSSFSFQTILNSFYPEEGALYRVEADLSIQPLLSPILTNGYFVPTLTYINYDTQVIHATSGSGQYIANGVNFNSSMHLSLDFVSLGQTDFDFVQVLLYNNSGDVVEVTAILTNVCVTKLSDAPPINNPYA